ncbi:MAG: fused response regulator/phosphatase [Ignavibacteria bacterium]|nr:fused response regulator/phosphatase [Ignavibacteria bacterium]
MFAKILVVDDEPDLEELIRQKFRKKVRENEFQFLFARNGVEALEKMNKDRTIDLVLTDINMPEMDGLTLLSELESLKIQTLKAVIVSAYGDMENIRTAMNRGAFDFLTKPIDFNDLELTINKTLQHLQIIKQAVVDQEQLIAVRRDLSIATRIQQSILPRKFPPFPDRHEMEIFADMVPAKEVGGDFYDFFFLDDDRLAFVIGDVSGKGVPAAIFMAVSRTLLRALAVQNMDPGECLRRMNTMLIPESETSMFVTVFYGILNTRTGEVQYSNGGHNSPYILRGHGTVEPLEGTGGLIVGILPHLDYDVKTIHLDPGDALFMYTDGVTETRDYNGNEFSDSRLGEFLRRVKDSSLKEIIRWMVEEVNTFSSGVPQADDITILMLRYLSRAQ